MSIVECGRSLDDQQSSLTSPVQVCLVTQPSHDEDLWNNLPHKLYCILVIETV